MEGYPMLMVGRINTVEMSILYVQCNPYENSNGILYQDNKVSPNVYMEAQKTLNSQNNPESKKQCWRYHNT
jgi:hypothetical protein